MNSVLQCAWNVFRRPAVLCSAAAMAIVLGAAEPAQADHRNPRVTFSIGNVDWGCRNECRPQRSFAQIERDRGFANGQRAGFNAGYRDALNRRSFCDAPRSLPCGVSRFFLRGFEDGFACSYAEGFQRGKLEQRHSRWSCR